MCKCSVAVTWASNSLQDMDILKQRISWAGNWTETNVIEARLQEVALRESFMSAFGVQDV